jgi:integrase/recombinase XerC
VYGELNGKTIRTSLKTRTWSVALAKVEAWQVEPHRHAEEVKREEVAKAESKLPLLSVARDKFLLYCKAERNASDQTIEQYRLTLRLLVNFKGEQTQLKDITMDDVRTIMGQRLELGRTPRTRAKELTNLKMFLSFCEDNDWISKSPARRVKVVIPKTKVTLPFEDDEIERMVNACDEISHGCIALRARTKLRAKALILGMAYTGLRVSDMATLKRSEIRQDGEAPDHVIVKTKSIHWTHFGELAVQALMAIPNEGPYFFWNGKSQLTSATASLRVTCARIGELAGVKGVAKPHRFRATFAKKILEETGDIRILQQLLGHSSVAITEKAYEWKGEKQKANLKKALAKVSYGKRDGTTGQLIEMPQR